ncbi:C6 zinc finger domain protein [Aspergillus heteromorphus CBS 117.55]|uniref:C6 zinc finger domain protein n=1 Tax=Aspergillus heteromorphus CBS 117.55 TaxID=1448321 RepID=A0A317VU30_9EURO|nr:C6 zinc finger domain protein [Aspergillus heteromorphus CBS 117.55]PWY77099.1 C6 zinc finger domain protein [Aspergillus heteromorphus CBS 117.55]
MANEPSMVSGATTLSNSGVSVDDTPAGQASPSHIYNISNTSFHHHYNVTTAEDDTTLYRVENSSLWPKKPDLAVHAGADKTAPTVAVCKFLHFSRDIRVGLGDPDDVNRINYEDLVAQDHTHAKYRWHMPEPSGHGRQRRSFLWTRTHSVGVEKSKVHKLSNRNFKLTDEQTGRIVALFTSAILKFKQTGKLQVYVDYGQQFDLMALITLLALYEKARRRRQAASSSGGGGGGGGGGVAPRLLACDELRPSCSNCSKRLSKCEYDSSTSLLWTNEEPQSRTRSTRSASEPAQSDPSLAATSNSLGILGRWGGDYGAPQAVPSLNFTDLELMMHWCNATYKTVSRADKTDHIWRDRVPEEALAHPFLMHGLLALSALHLAQTRPDNRRSAYINTAVAHQNRALALFREMLCDINPSNAKAMFSFASIVVLYTFGFPHLPESDDPWACVDDMIQVHMLARGVQQVLSQAIPGIRSGDWGVVLEMDDGDEGPPEDVRLALQRLHEANSVCGTKDPAHDTAVYEYAIETLADMMATARVGLASVSAAFRWAIRQKPEFMDLLRERQPLALVILAHHSAFFHRLRDVWYIGTWGIRVTRAVWQGLDEQWRPLLDKPMLEIFGNTHPVDV